MKIKSLNFEFHFTDAPCGLCLYKRKTVLEGSLIVDNAFYSVLDVHKSWSGRFCD